MKSDSFFKRLKNGLAKTSSALVSGIVRATTGRISVDGEMLEEIEEALILADVGMPTTIKLVDALKAATRSKEVKKPEDVRPFLKKKVAEMVTIPPLPEEKPGGTPHVILMIGVNGAGKTTTIGKLSHHYKQDGKSVLLAAGDTFRAAAIEQLKEWSDRVGTDFIAHHPNSDPAAVAYDGMKAAIARKKDIVIIDTAGRLHTRQGLMEQMKKIGRIIDRELPGAPHEILLVLDGSTGQNALIQAREFHATLPITGVVLTKLDGSSKGGAVIGIVQEVGIPVKYVGVGEGIEDLQPFDAELFAEALL